MSNNIVVVGSCMIDFTCFSQRLPHPGETIVGDRFEKKFGGKGANECVTAARLGGSTTLIASLGADLFGYEYLEQLEKENINTSFISFQKEKHSGIAHITVASDGENSIVIVPGANGLLNPEQIDLAADVVRSAAVLLCQFEIPLETTLHALKLHKGYGTSIVNASPVVKNLDPDILRCADIFCVNEMEVESLTGIGKDIVSQSQINLGNAQEAIDSLLDMGCNTVIVTLGPMGAVFASKENRIVKYVPTAPVTAVDTTGAGDAFLGALAYFIANHPHLTTEECIKRSCRIATESVMKYGTHASYPTRNDLPPELFS